MGHSGLDSQNESEFLLVLLVVTYRRDIEASIAIRPMRVPTDIVPYYEATPRTNAI